MTLRFTPPEDIIPEAGLLRWCETDRQREVVQACMDIGNVTHAAKHLKTDERAMRRMLAKIRARAAAQGHAPEYGMTAAVPDGFMLARHAQYYDKDGKAAGKWVIATADAERKAELMREAVQAFMADHKPVDVPPFAFPEANADIIPWIQIGDAHIGMLAHEAEAGADFNVEIAEREICAAFKLIIDQIEPCERLVVNDLGDRDHIENTEKVTARSGVPLDAGRPRQMIRTSSRVMRFVIDLALTKARVVDVIGNQGNHSRFGDFWMNELLQVAYAGSDRVNILDNESVFIGYRMGKTLVMTHHSDKCPVDRLAGVMMSDFQKDFAETDFHYIDIGHIHHKTAVKERDGIVVESWNTLARGDKWHRESGYRARQSMSVVFRSRTYGDVGRKTVPIQMVYDAIQHGHNASGLTYVPQQRRAFAA